MFEAYDAVAILERWDQMAASSWKRLATGLDAWRPMHFQLTYT